MTTNRARSAPVVESTHELVGSTPVVRLRRVAPEGGAAIYAKAEHLNPSGSSMDRVAGALLDAAPTRGLTAGQPLVIASSGDLGIALALMTITRGHRLTVVMPDDASVERRQLLRACGVDVVLTDAEAGIAGARARAARIAEGDAYPLDAYTASEVPDVHAETTGRELIEALGAIDAFVCAVGTGGTLRGVARALREAGRTPAIVAVEPEASPVLSGGAPGPTRLVGVGSGFVPPHYDAATVDRVIAVSDRAAYEMKVRLAREEGLLVGLSAGANLVAACAVAEELGPEAIVATVLPDTGERYFSLDGALR
ncbi:MAG: PLP-dependent cysteine synthase family protein [Sandaracinaceae bacterium]